ncbi:hypothetical protein SEA_C3PO_88 [Corynebacterium phage C3PO]|uniref:Uncharacterized protein n=2 Tax=Corynebacterium virus C3PO TaxID=2560393 RepID=A0A3G3LWA6_9CAUD|nr:hypothetical protein FDJ10_gp55 [Corynebacterium phage C3PO]ATW58496.1 hypothetical protein SEA_C3PO_88 [Corynebacterium phage C3PO]AYQ98385.1 hypothetical protein CRUELLA_89 [Corynebacterium phage Cruella]
MAVAQLIETDLLELTQLARSNQGRKIAHNTYIHAGSHGLELTYHGNRIVFKPYGGLHYEMTNAGWHTVTTAGRLHQLTRANGGGMVNIKGGVMRYTAPSGTVHEMNAPLLIDMRTGEVINP